MSAYTDAALEGFDKDWLQQQDLLRSMLSLAKLIRGLVATSFAALSSHGSITIALLQPTSGAAVGGLSSCKD